jgi:hypothetical protein
MGIEEIMGARGGPLRAIEGVTGLGIGERAGQPVIVVFIKALPPAERARVAARVPAQYLGYPTEVRDEIRVDLGQAQGGRGRDEGGDR